MEIDKKLAKILVVDDDINQANATCESLISLGYEVSAVFSSKEAEFLLRQQNFNIVLSDCLMPETDGYVLAQNVYKQFGTSISIILMSGIFKAKSMNLSTVPTICSFIQKPVDDNHLDLELKKILKNRFYKSQELNIYSLVSHDVLPIDQLIEGMSKIKQVKGGDVLLLFAYLMRSKSEGVLHIGDSNCSVEVTFYNGKVVNFNEMNMQKAIREHLTKYKLMSTKDISMLNKLKEKNQMLYLVDQGFISPHQYVYYIKSRISYYLGFFGKKSIVNVHLKSHQSSSEELFQTHTSHIFDMRIHYTQLTDNLLKCVQESLPETYLKSYLESCAKSSCHFDKLFDLSTQAQMPILEPLFKNKNQLQRPIEVNQLNETLGSSSLVRKALFWGLLQGLVQIKDNHAVAVLEQCYYEKYSRMLKELKKLRISQVFSYLGCLDNSDQQKIKTVYRQFMKYNHIDNFVQFGSRLCHVIEQVNKMVIDAYNTMTNEENLRSAHKAQMVKESSDFIKVSSLKTDLQHAFMRGNFDQVKDIMSKLRKLSQDNSQLKALLGLWDIVLEVKSQQFNIPSDRKIDFMSQVKQTELDDKDEFLLLYVEGVLLMCGENWKQAQTCMDRCLELNSDFYLARMEAVKLKSIRKRSSGLSVFLNKAKELKKSS